MCSVRKVSQKGVFMYFKFNIIALLLATYIDDIITALQRSHYHGDCTCDRTDILGPDLLVFVNVSATIVLKILLGTKDCTSTAINWQLDSAETINYFKRPTLY
jgi:hypothetical protein